MSDKHKLTAELLKYPILVATILIALIIAKHFLGLEFGAVTEISTSGVKLQNKTSTAILNLESKVQAIESKVSSIEKLLNVSEIQQEEIQIQAFEQSQTVSNQTASLSVSTQELSKKTQNLKGYIWIGNYDNKWNPGKLAYTNTRQPITQTPDQIIENTEYVVLGNMVIRNGLPENDDKYYWGKEALGVVTTGSRVRILQKPTAITRPRANQYWAEIEVVELASGKN